MGFLRFFKGRSAEPAGFEEQAASHLPSLYGAAVRLCSDGREADYGRLLRH